MQVVITNSVALNGGDAAILQGIVTILSESFGSAVDVTVLDSRAKVASKYHPQLRFQQIYMPYSGTRRMRRLVGHLRRTVGLQHRLLNPVLPTTLRKNLRAYQSADIILSTGGTYLVEHYDLSIRLTQFGIALQSGAPVIMFTQSLGPFRSPSNRKALSDMLPRMALILLRDGLSAQHIEDLGLKLPQIHIVADAAWALVDVERIKNARRRTIGDPPKIAISVRAWQHFKTGVAGDKMLWYQQALTAAVEQLVRTRRAEVTFISTCQGISEYWTDDSTTAGEIAGSLAPDVRQNVSVDKEFYTPTELMERITAFDLVIATRMHMAILSLASGVPVLPIAYEFKTQELFSQLGLASWVEDIETVSANTLPARVDNFLEALPGIREGLFDRVMEQRASAFAAASHIREHLGPHPLHQRPSMTTQNGVRA